MRGWRKKTREQRKEWFDLVRVLAVGRLHVRSASARPASGS